MACLHRSKYDGEEELRKATKESNGRSPCRNSRRQTDYKGLVFLGLPVEDFTGWITPWNPIYILVSEEKELSLEEVKLLIWVWKLLTEEETRTTLLIAIVLILFFTINYPPLLSTDSDHRRFLSTALFTSTAGSSIGGANWEKQVRHSSTPRRPNGMSVLVTDVGGFVGSHCALALKKRGDGVLLSSSSSSY
ncbi:hypothetical protein ACFE04_025887 [Oxalis oulophora]